MPTKLKSLGLLLILSSMCGFDPLMGRPAQAAEPVRVLFLGDRGHHHPADRFEQIKPVLRERGIELTYTEALADLNPVNLAKFQGLLVYANIDEIEPEPAEAVLNYVRGGGGFIPLHCASYCFRNSDDLVKLTGPSSCGMGRESWRTKSTRPTIPS